MAVVSAVATVMETDPIELDPLYSVLDPEELDALFRSTRERPPRGGVYVTFDFNHHEVTVHSDGSIEIDPPE